METMTEASFRRRHPWDEWFDGKIRKAEAGVDFDGEPAAFRYTLRAAANRHGFSIRTSVKGNFVIFQTSQKA